MEKGSEPGASTTCCEPGTARGPGRRDQRRLAQISGLLLLLATGGAMYLATVSLLGGGVAGCGPQSGCNKVLSSHWAYWLGLPVSIPAAACYLLLLLLLTLLYKTHSAAMQRRAQSGIAFLGVVVVGAAIWFVCLQLFVVHALCKFCLAIHLSAVAAVALLPSKQLSANEADPVSRFPAFRFSLFGSIPLLAGVVVLAMLIAGQVLVKKQMFAVTALLGGPAWSAHQIVLHNGKFRLNPDDLPRLAGAKGTNYVISLFDYTCSHCRALHPLLKQAQQTSAEPITIISLPVPLDAQCNPLILITAPANQDACEYAKIALAVWHSKPEAFAELDDWAFAAPSTPSLAQMRAQAESLIGKDTLDHALKSSWVSHQLQTDVDLYLANARVIGDGRLPQLMLGRVITHGAFEDAGEITKLIQQTFGTPNPR